MPKRKITDRQMEQSAAMFLAAFGPELQKAKEKRKKRRERFVASLSPTQLKAYRSLRR